MRSLTLVILLSSVAVAGSLSLKPATESRSKALNYVNTRAITDLIKVRNLCVVEIDDAVAKGQLSTLTEVSSFDDLAVTNVIKELKNLGYIAELSRGRRGLWLHIYWDAEQYKRDTTPFKS